MIFNHNYKEAGLSKGVRALMKGAAVAASVYSGVKTVQSVRVRPGVDDKGNMVNEVYVDKNTATYQNGQTANAGAGVMFAMANQRLMRQKLPKTPYSF